VIELLAAAWGRVDDATDGPRAQAQHWLADQGYEPSQVKIGNRALTWAAAFLPWLHTDDHPTSDVEQMVYRVSMPASIEGFVHATVPGASRVEFCHTEHRVVIHHGWEPIAEGCVPGPQDRVIELGD
jgi:hypothetical protein